MIVLTVEPRGRRIEGLISGALKPGICLQVVPGSTPDAGNRLTWQPYDKAGSGVPALIAVLDADWYQGKTANDAYVSGTRGFIYFPLNGDELNMLISDQSGTGATSDFSVGDPLKVEDATGKLIDGALGTSPSLGANPFQVMENYNDMVGDTRLKVMFTGV